jgi:divalent metal cation (Fe/Co/Zn/Cd) transporter
VEVVPRSAALPVAPTEPANRTEKLRTEVGLALGIVVGLASLVQGYDSTDPFRTIVVALAIGFIGFGVIYGTTIRR